MMEMGISTLLWKGGAKWVTTIFAMVVVGLLILAFSGFPGDILRYSFLLSTLLSVTGFAVGLNSFRLFGGRKNFVGKMLILFSTSVLLGGLVWVVAFITFPSITNIFLETPAAITGIFVLSLLIATFALISSARAVVLEFNRRIQLKILIAIVFVAATSLLTQEAEVLAGLTFLGALEVSAPYYAVILVLMVGALVLVAQLGKWYVTPEIRMIAYGYVFLGVVPPLVRDYLLLSTIAYIPQVAIFFLLITMSFYFISLGMSHVRPRRQETMLPDA
jgi:hypothetical protein